MKVFYCDHFVLPLPAGHRFPMAKYAQLRERVAAARAPDLELTEPRAASLEELHLAHCPHYVQRVLTGALSQQEIRALGLPWSPQLVERSRRSAGATVQAVNAALLEGAAASLAGGTHHAGYSRGEGYCVFNDAAIAALMLARQRAVERVLIVDADVHQGNGTAEILGPYPRLFTFSIHGARNYPAHKLASDLDIALPDGTGDAEYLHRLERGLQRAFAAARPELVIYLAGADPFAGDSLGRLSLSKDGLAARDALICEFCDRSGAALATTMAGGYAAAIEDVVDIHFQSVMATLAYWRGKKMTPRVTPRGS